jgi:hypothetical protein
MSKPHLLELEQALARRGWEVVVVHPGDGYSISATWENLRSSRQRSLFIEFDGMDADGGSCLPLEESYGCHVRGQKDATFYFRRVNKSRPLWQQELAAFVNALDN